MTSLPERRFSSSPERLSCFLEVDHKKILKTFQSELDQQNMKMVMEQNELNSKLMSEKSQLQQAQMELMQYQSSPAPGQKERDEFNQLKQQEGQLEQAKTEALRLLTEVRSEKIRAQNIVDELQKEKDEKEGKNDAPTPTLPTVTPTPSAGSLKSLNTAG